MLLQILLMLVVGFAVGAIARFVMPGAQPMGWMATTDMRNGLATAYRDFLTARAHP